MPGLTVDEFRSLTPGVAALTDPALEIILDGTWALIESVCGPAGEVVEVRDGGLSYILLARRIADPGDVSSITERSAGVDTVLDEDDWQLRGGGTAIQRLVDGTNPSSYWIGQITIEYSAADDVAIRKLAQAELAKLEIVSNPGLAMQVVGNWTIQFQQGRTYAELRADILATLTTVGPVFA